MSSKYYKLCADYRMNVPGINPCFAQNCWSILCAHVSKHYNTVVDYVRFGAHAVFARSFDFGKKRFGSTLTDRTKNRSLRHFTSVERDFHERVRLRAGGKLFRDNDLPRRTLSRPERKGPDDNYWRLRRYKSLSINSRFTRQRRTGILWCIMGTYYRVVKCCPTEF